MSIDSTWLRCPNCSLPLAELPGRVVGCAAGHRFDLSKHGTLTLLPPRAPHTLGDSREMLEARAALLGSGAFDPIAEAIADACDPVAHGSSEPLRIADLGCGTGHYSAHLAARFPGAEFLLGDRSPVAVRMASKAVPNAVGIVLDLWRPLPIRDAIADVSINVFAPRNPEEFARITKPGGAVVVVVPTDRHLRELRAQGGMLEIPGGKAEMVTDQLARAGFRAGTRHRLEYRIALDAAQARSLVRMGPSAHHVGDGDDDALTEARAGGLESAAPREAKTEVTVSVDVLRFHRG
ncbi:methyltransferase domain-containing protein [Agromyces sp. ZXT2-6]|uniref:methyltransferase domain-containing protein n=1 Tax=Agromyces sp. ZXT2-6 TaxID=3461153 RepID=UPI004054DFC4